MKVSKFNNIFSKSVVQINLQDEINDIKHGKYKVLIQQCRSFINNDYDKYKELKIKLPIVTFCGTFINGRKLSNLDIYNNMMILDIDNLDEVELITTKENLKKDNYIYAVWLSPSGKGLKALVKIESNPDEHKFSFLSLKNYFDINYNIKLDNSGSDVTRLCFVSWDDDLFLNENSEVYKEKIIPENSKKDKREWNISNKSLARSAYATEGLNKPEHRKIISLIIKYLTRNEISITSSFDEWYRVAIAIASVFSYDVGKKYYLSLCELDKEKHNEYKSINMLEYCYNNRNLNITSAITLGTIVYYAKSKGFITKKEKFENLS